MAVPSHAATVAESGDFSSNPLAPTRIQYGNDYVTGGIGTGDYDYLHFTSMNPGATTISITLTAPPGRNVAQGRVYYSTTPFSLTNQGTRAGNIRVNPGQPGPQTITFNLGSSFAGSLYISLNLSLGPVMRYSVYVPGNIGIPGVPIPAPVLLLGAALAGMGAVSHRRRRRPGGQPLASRDGLCHGDSIV